MSLVSKFGYISLLSNFGYMSFLGNSGYVFLAILDVSSYNFGHVSFW